MRLRIGVAGLGWPGQQHLKAIEMLPEQAGLAAVCDADAGRMSGYPDGVAKYTDLSQMLQDPAIDAVILAVPHHLHEELAVEALNRGKHVLIEKPMARNAEEAERMNAAARDNGRMLMIAQNWRYSPWCMAVKKVLESGELGEIRMVQTEFVLNFHGNYPQGSWVYDGRLAGGGALASLAIHNLDLLRFLFGEARTVSGFCLYTDDWSTNGAENWATATIGFDSGAVCSVFTGYTPYNAPDSGTFRIFGDNGTLYNGNGPQGQGLWITSSQRRNGKPGYEQGPYEALDPAKLLPGLHDHSQANQLAHFADCCRTGRQPATSGEDNIGTIRLLEAIYRSAQTKETVRL